jgi:hypothetical protein
VDTRSAAVAYIEEVLPVEKVYDQDGWLLYGVEQPPAPNELTVDAEPLNGMVLGEGWAEDEPIQGVSANWAVAQDAQLLLPTLGTADQGATGVGDHRLTVTALPFDYPGAAQQTVALQVNGHPLEPVALSPGWNRYGWAVPGSFLRPGLNDLRLQFERLDAPADVLPESATISTTGVQAPVAIEVNSGGPANFAYATVGSGNEAEDASVHSPGYNVATVDPRRGKVIDRRGFDTTSSGTETQAAELAEWIAEVPDGQIVLAVMQADGAARLTDETLAAFRTIGGQADPRDPPGGVHAIIGVKGATPGTALEAAGLDNGWLRVAPDRRTLAIALDSLTWEAAGP